MFNLKSCHYATDQQILWDYIHAWYNEYKITVNIDDGEVDGNMPARALRLILEWWELNKEALMEVWNRAHSGVPLGTIEPLK